MNKLRKTLTKYIGKGKKFFAHSTYQKLTGLGILLIIAISIPLTVIILHSSTDYQQHAASISRCGRNKIGFCVYGTGGIHLPSNQYSIPASTGDCFPLGGLPGAYKGFNWDCAVNINTPITCSCDQTGGLAAYHGGTPPYNHYKCTNGLDGYCSRDQVCDGTTLPAFSWNNKGYAISGICSTACFSDSDCSNGQSCALGIHQCVKASAGAVAVDACADVQADGYFCGGSNGNSASDNPNTLYHCQTDKIIGTPQECPNGCQQGSPGQDSCAPGSSDTSNATIVKDYNECEAVNFGACQFTVLYHLAHVTEDSNGNWTCKDLGYDANCDPNAKKAATATNTPTPTPSPTITPTPTPAGDVVLNVAVKLMGIGLRGNLNPRHRLRKVHIQIYNATDDPSQPNITPVLDLPQVVFTYNATSGYFGNSKIDLGKKFASGDYQILVKSPGYLRSEIVDAQGNKVFTLTAGQTTTFPTITLVGGDISALYNVMDISDFYALVGCYKDKASTSTCADAGLADINDDGVVDGVDINYWLDAMNTLQTQNKPGGDGIPGN